MAHSGHSITFVQLNVVSLIGHHAHLCYDVFLKEHDDQFRVEIGRNVDLPIFEIRKRGDTSIFFRNPKMDSTASAIYRELQGCDKGPLPYFEDSRNPPVYVDGIRLEDMEVAKRLSERDDDEKEDEAGSDSDHKGSVGQP